MWKRISLESLYMYLWKLKYVASIMDDSGITCDEITESNDEEIKTILSFNEIDIICKAHNFFILLVFLLITIALLIAVSVYCYLIEYQAKQKHLLAFHVTKLKQFSVGSINRKWVIKLRVEI